MSISPNVAFCAGKSRDLFSFNLVFLLFLALLVPGLAGCGAGNMSLAAGRITITGLTPASGPVSGGNVIRILGTGFKGNTSVRILSNEARIVRYVSPTEIDVA